MPPDLYAGSEVDPLDSHLENNNDLLGQRLLAAGRISEDDIEKACHLQESVGGRFGSALIRQGAISEDNLLEALSAQLGLPILDQAEIPDATDIYRDMAGSAESFDWFLSQEVVIWKTGEGQLNCLARDILDPAVSETLRHFHPGAKISYALTTTYLLERLLSDLNREHSVDSLFQQGEDARQLRELAEEAPVVEFVNNMMAQAVDVNASDIHVEPEEGEFHIRFRIDGVLQKRMSQPSERFAAVASRIKLVSGLDIAERRLPQDGRLSTRMGGQDLDVRVSTVPCVHGESIVMRLLPKERDELSLSKLGMEADHLALMRQWAASSGGIVLVTGPTGSGKSTTLHAALSDSNDGIRKIITVEDPVEFEVPGITQIQAHNEIGYTFARALRAILRQDPDVIMIGEVRDLETAEIAIQSALSGHLVLSTLHTNEAISSFTRLVDMGVEPFLVAAPIKGVQAQRLVRCVCPNCATADTPAGELRDQLSRVDESMLGENWVKAVGCPQCQMTGYNGRMGIYQLVEVDPALQDLIVRGASLNEMRAYAAGTGMRTLFEDGMIKASKGLTTIDEVYRVVTAEEAI